MTILLLFVLGVVWCLLLWVLLRWGAGFSEGRFWRAYVIPVLASLDVLPLFTEYLTYYDFQKYCDVHAGMVVNRPVVADALLVDAWYEFTVDIFRAQAVKTVFWEPRNNDGPIRFRDTAWKAIPEPNLATCQLKKLVNGAKMNSYLETSYEALKAEGICLIPAHLNRVPRYQLVVKFNADRFIKTDEYLDTPNTIDSKLVLIDTYSGQTMSEYRNVSTPTGSLLKGVLGRHWSRYSCEEHTTLMGAMIWDKRLQVTEFLEKALLPLPED
ncbi:hypothetical protein [Kordiimonas aestuarii]|uniref:hypothetical protein n=1 Tax=Kordiimonas aestuarii TaxID=1005925 RepID=UPI0021D3EB23|nr:hypothetical protein [Kordiimonas aestuarii]